MPDQDLMLFRNLALTDSATLDQTSSVGEPSVANNGRHVLVTGNWYASISNDDGGTWSYLNPGTTFPSADGGFCCDQIAHYDRSRDLMFWLLQYATSDGTNRLRLAVRKGASLGGGGWYYYDFRPGDVNAGWNKHWFDFPDLALSNDFLYLTSNMYDRNNSWQRSVVLRLPLQPIEAQAGFSYRYFHTNQFGSLRCVQGARETMYIAAHAAMNAMRIWAWPEDSTSLTFHTVSVSQWDDGNRIAPGPDGRNWLTRCDGRLTAAWIEGCSTLGFGWTANAQEDRPFPFVRVVRIDADTMSLIDEPDIWNQRFAFAYPFVSPNDRGHLGISLFFGGGRHFPSHCVGVDDDYTGAGRWALRPSQFGTHGPIDGKWGDYLCCRRHAADGLTWIATGFTLQGGGNRRDILPRMIRFGRRRDIRGQDRWIQA